MVDIALGKGLYHINELRPAVQRGFVVIGVDFFQVLVEGHVDRCRPLEGLNALLKIAEISRTTTALRNALGKLSDGSLLGAQCALLDNTFLLVKVTHAVGARHHAELAPNALVLVHLNGAIFHFVRGARRAHFDAMGTRAVLALQRDEIHFHIGELAAASFFGVGPHAQHFIPKVTNGHIVHDFASNAASQTADTSIKVGDDGILGHNCTPFLSA